MRALKSTSDCLAPSNLYTVHSTQPRCLQSPALIWQVADASVGTQVESMLRNVKSANISLSYIDGESPELESSDQSQMCCG